MQLAAHFCNVCALIAHHWAEKVAIFAS